VRKNLISKNKIFVFITLYNTYSFPLCYQRQADIIYLLDNGKCVINKSELPDNYVYIKNETNLGLSSAFNKIIKTIELHDDDFLLFFDQDSIIPDGFVKNLIQSYEKYEHSHNIGLIGANYKDENTGKVAFRHTKKKISEQVYSVPSLITSSMLTRYKYIKEVGFWNENYFLDYADYELSYRYRRYGLKCAVDESITFSHTLGENVEYGREHYLNPFRYYYVIRESVKMLSEQIGLYDKIHFFAYVLLYPVSILFLEDKKKERMKFYFMGLLNGIKRINGELERK